MRFSKDGVYNVRNTLAEFCSEPSMSESETVTIRLFTEIKGKLEALAASTNRSKSWLAAQAIASYV
ncbi:MAG: ribbon-helix-helix domain-containing protein [Timaviella obliquedivisa GSE-PSE-MK23-08B]|jgi:hypothetical protein|nr:ribbon-helix-helix domain-containing protein [Timaviella obliquedivisa GSE-PSE-MK23-08B]